MTLTQDKEVDDATLNLATGLVIGGILAVLSTPPLLLLILWRVW
jgi:hypothetical protein